MSEDNKTPIEGGLLGPWSDDEEMAFRAFCSDQGLPETKPQAIFEFLVTQSDRGLARVKRLHKSIAAVQASIGHPGAADDLIIRALIQRIETEEKKENDSGSL